MARSLTVKHEEEATTNPLFTVFIVIAVAWLLLSALGGSPAASVAGAATADAPPIDAR